MSLRHLIEGLSDVDEALKEELSLATRARLAENPTNMYRQIVRGQSRFARLIHELYADVFSAEDLERFLRHVDRYIVDAATKRKIEQFFEESFEFMPDHALVDRLQDLGLNRFLESDHLLEQRIYETYFDGLPGLMRGQRGRYGPSNRTPRGPRVNITACPAPATDIVAHQLLSSNIDIPYIHRTYGSKSSRMRDLIPWGSEAEFLPEELWTVHRWGLREFGIPRAILDGPIKRDFVEALVHGLTHDAEFRQQMLRMLPEGDGLARLRQMRSFGDDAMDELEALFIVDIRHQPRSNVDGIIASRLKDW